MLRGRLGRLWGPRLIRRRTYCRTWTGAVGTQLGSEFRSNASGDGPNPNKCIHCESEVSHQWKVRPSCAAECKTLPKEDKECAVCHEVVGGRMRPTRNPEVFCRSLLSSDEGLELVSKLKLRRDMIKCPILNGEWLRVKPGCAYGFEWNVF